MSLRTIRAREVAAKAKELAAEIESASWQGEGIQNGPLALTAKALDKLADAVANLADEADELELRIDHQESKKNPKPARDVY